MNLGPTAITDRLPKNFAARAGVVLGVLLIAFVIYSARVGTNPPGFYIDESALSYNAALVAKTGAGEFGDKFPLFFKIYDGPFTQWSNPTQIYLLAALFAVVEPTINAARIFAAFWVFAACVMLGFLARRISGDDRVGLIVGMAAVFTPWLFDGSRIVLETFFYPLAVVLLLWSVYAASRKDAWSILNVLAVAASLILVTYSYTIGRMLGPLLAAGLIVFATSFRRILSVASVWVLYALSLIPLYIYYTSNPDIATRFRYLTYIKEDSTYSEIFWGFIGRFFQDINPLTMIFVGDVNARHHMYGAYGSFLLGIFILSVMGVVLILWKHREAWWFYVILGTLASVVPGSMTIDPFHTLRMIAYPVFLLVLAVPAISWLLASGLERAPLKNRRIALAALLFIAALQAVNYLWVFHSAGTDRGAVFDAEYFPLYLQALGEPQRPIYLVDGKWGPMYMHSLWYSTAQGIRTDLFYHQPYGSRPPAGSLVLSSEGDCTGCEIIARRGVFLLYRVQ